MITIKSKREIQLMHEAGKLLASCHREIAKKIRAGITTLEIDTFVEEYLIKHGATPEQKGYKGYPYATCASVNDEICHGFPTAKPLKEGDIVTIDMVVNLDGGLADSAWTHVVGNISETAKHLLNVTRESLYIGIRHAWPGNSPKMHEDPHIPHYGSKGKGPRLDEGMVITIEPMVNVGTWRCKMDPNGWTARTVDGKLSAQYEHTIVITRDGPLILTEQF